jgi:hypothetical protein
MDALTSAQVVHYFDTHLHRILCGLRGVEHRSTKHARSVTCQACVGLLVTRLAASDARGDSDVVSGRGCEAR